MNAFSKEEICEQGAELTRGQVCILQDNQCPKPREADYRARKADYRAVTQECGSSAELQPVIQTVREKLRS